MTQFTLRKATGADRAGVLSAEKLSTPGLQYLPQVFDQFLADSRGEFTVAEIDGEIVACAKFTVLPDSSGWLETIRVVPARQGLGIGKRFYENYFDIAQREGVDTMRMYTGIGNAVSKGLAERFGLQLAETFDSMALDDFSQAEQGDFRPITDPDAATALIMPHAADWGGYLVMNRTFYRLTAALCAHLAMQGMVYGGDTGVVVAGARFMPEKALRLGFFTGDAAACLSFVAHLAQQKAVPTVSCLFPATQVAIRQTLSAHGYAPSTGQLIVMEVTGA